MDITALGTDKVKNQFSVESFYDELRHDINVAEKTNKLSHKDRASLENVITLVRDCGKFKGTPTFEALQQLSTKVVYNTDVVDVTNSTTVSNIKKNISAFLSAENIKSPKDVCELSAELFKILTGNVNHTSIYTSDQVSRENALSLNSVYGSVGASIFPKSAISVYGASMEAFGNNVDNLEIDVATAIRLAIWRQIKSVTDRMFPRRTVSQPIVTFVESYGEIYDIKKSTDTSSEVRLYNRVPFINTMDDAAYILNTTARRCTLLPINDPNNKVLYNGTENVLQANISFDLMQLSRDPMDVSSSIDSTDLLSEGGFLKKLIVEVGSDKIEVLLSALPASNLSMTASNDDSGQQSTYITYSPLFNADSPVFQSSAKSAALSKFTDYSVTQNFQIRFDVNAKNGQGSCSVQSQGALRVFDNKTYKEVTDPNHPIMSSVSALKIKAAGLEPDLKLSEENLKRTTTTLRVNTFQRQIGIPVSKNYLVQLSMFQQKQDEALALVSDALTVGNDIRGLTMVNSKADDIRDMTKNSMQIMLAQDAIIKSNISIAAQRSRPYIHEEIFDLSESLSIANLKEAELMSDIHAKLSQLFLKATAMMFGRSLFLTNLEGGEQPVINVTAHPILVQLLVCIKNYHPALDDVISIDANSKADVTMALQNGTRLNFFTTYFKEWGSQFRGYITRENANPDDVLNYATVYDVGTMTAKVTLPNVNTSVAVNYISNSRVSPITTNPLGFIISVKGIEALYSRLNLLPLLAQSIVNSQKDGAATGASAGTGDDTVSGGANTGTGTGGKK